MKLAKLAWHAILAVCATAFLSVKGADYYWDGGDGDWQVGGAGWKDGSSAVNWENGNTAVLGGAAGILSLGGAVSASGITVLDSDFIVTNNYNVTAGAVNIASGASLTLAVGGATPTWSSLSGGGTLVINRSGDFKAHEFFNANGALNFNGTLRVMGGGYMTFGGDNDNLFQVNGTAFALDTGPSGSGKDVVVMRCFNGKTLNLTSLTGYGKIRCDWGAGGLRTICVNQMEDTVFNGGIAAHDGGANRRSLHLVKDGSGTLDIEGALVDGANAHLSVVVTNGTLKLQGNNTSRGLISVGPGAVLDVWNANGGSGFGAGNNGMSANYIVEEGGLIKGIRHGRTAFGTGTITLNGGALAQYDGNWAWTVPIVLAEGKSSTIENQSSKSSGRWLKLQGEISGSGDVTFNDVTGTMTSQDNGFILTGMNTMSGTVTIPATGKVRVGGVPGDSTDLAAGTGGTLGTASVVNDGTLTFARSDSLSLPNTITGSGMVRVGSPDMPVTDTQIITLTADNSYSGGTGVNRGALFVNGTHSGGSHYDVGGTLGGSGTITIGTRDVTIVEGGKLAPGSGIGEGGTLSVNKLTMNEGAKIVIDNASDKVVVSDSLTLNSNAVELPNEEALNKSGSQLILVCEGTVTGTLPGKVADSDWYIRRVDNSFYLEYVSGTVIMVK